MISLKHHRRVFSRLCFGLLLSLTIAACQRSTDEPQAEPLVAGVNFDSAPWVFTDDSGSIIGFEVDLIKAIAESLAVEVKFVDVPFIELFPSVASGRLDVAAAGISVTKERMKIVNYSQPYYDSDLSLTARLDSEIDEVADLAQRKVAMDTGSTSDEWVTTNRARYGFGEIIRYEGSIAGAMDDLADSIIDGYVTDIPMAFYYSKSRPELEVVERINTNEKFALMFAKENALRDEFNAVITELKGDGTIAEIHEKWFGEPPEPDSSTVVVLPIPQL